MIKACIFDLDGTLADTLDSMAYVTNIIMEKFGLKTLPVDNFRYYSGEGANMLIRRALKDAGDPELAHYDEGQKLYREMFEADPMYKVVPYKGIPETLKKLKEHGMKLAVCSNKPHPAAVKVIAQLFDGEFDMVVGQSEAIRRKPAPDGPLMVAEKFGVKPEECMYVGDFICYYHSSSPQSPYQPCYKQSQRPEYAESYFHLLLKHLRKQRYIPCPQSPQNSPDSALPH